MINKSFFSYFSLLKSLISRKLGKPNFSPVYPPGNQRVQGIKKCSEHKMCVRRLSITLFSYVISLRRLSFEKFGKNLFFTPVLTPGNQWVDCKKTFIYKNCVTFGYLQLLFLTFFSKIISR